MIREDAKICFIPKESISIHPVGKYAVFSSGSPKSFSHEIGVNGISSLQMLNQKSIRERLALRSAPQLGTSLSRTAGEPKRIDLNPLSREQRNSMEWLYRHRVSNSIGFSRIPKDGLIDRS